MKRSHLYLLILILIPFYSCAKIEKSDEGVMTEFNVGFDNTPALQGLYIDVETNKEELFFVKDSPSPKILFFDIESGLISDSIDLSQLAVEFENIDKVSIRNKDSIIAITKKPNKIIGFDRECTLHFKHNVAEVLKHEESVYHLYGSMLPTDIRFGNSLILGSEWQKKRDTKAHKTEHDQHIDHFRGYCKSARLAKVNNIYTDAPHVSFGLQEYYTQLVSPTINPYYEYSNFYLINKEEIIYSNYYNRNVYKIDSQTLDTEDWKQIIPKSTEILTSLKFKGSIDPNDRILERENRKKSPYIANVLYSNTKEEYYFLVKTAEDFSIESELGYPFYIAIYDKDLEYKREIVVKSDQFKPQGAIMTSKGLLIEKINLEADKNRGFVLFDMKEPEK